MSIAEKPTSRQRSPHTRPRRRRKTVRGGSWAGSWLGHGVSSDALTVILTALVFLLPLASVAAFSRQHGPPPVAVETALMVAGAVLSMAVGLWQTSQIPSYIPRFLEGLRRGPLPWLVALLGWNCLCAILAPDKRLALTALLPMAAGVTFCWAAQRGTDSRRIKHLVDALLGMVLLVSLVSILVTAAALNQNSSKLTAKNTHTVWDGATHRGHARTQVDFVAAPSRVPPGAQDSFVPVLLLPLCVLLAAYSSTNPKRRLAAGASALAAVSALVLTGTFIPALPGLAVSLLLLIGLTGRYLPALRHADLLRYTLILLLTGAWLRILPPLPAMPRTAVPALLLWSAALAAFLVTGKRALPRLPAESGRLPVLLGAMAGAAAPLGDALFHPQSSFLLDPSRPPGQALFFLSLLLGLGMACAAPQAAGPVPPAVTFREALGRPWGWARLAGAVLLTAVLLALTAWTLPMLSAGRG